MVTGSVSCRHGTNTQETLACSDVGSETPKQAEKGEATEATWVLKFAHKDEGKAPPLHSIIYSSPAVIILRLIFCDSKPSECQTRADRTRQPFNLAMLPHITPSPLQMAGSSRRHPRLA